MRDNQKAMAFNVPNFRELHFIALKTRAGLPKRSLVNADLEWA